MVPHVYETTMHSSRMSEIKRSDYIGRSHFDSFRRLENSFDRFFVKENWSFMSSPGTEDKNQARINEKP